MQNLLPSKLVSVTWGMLGSGETVWLMGGGSLGFFADLTATVIEITIARTMSMNKIGLSAIKLNDRGSTGWMVGPAIVGEGEAAGLGSSVGVGAGVLGEIVGAGPLDGVACDSRTY